MYVCDEAVSAVLSVSEEGISKVVDVYDENPLQGPSSAVFGSDGRMYFADRWARLYCLLVDISSAPILVGPNNYVAALNLTYANTN